MKAFDKPLSAKEEKEMLTRFAQGDISARNVLIERNMRLVAHMVKKYMDTNRDLEDLISVGTIGLIKAVNSYKPDKSTRLATYAAKCIDNEILMMLRSERRKMNEVSIYEAIGADKEGNEISILDVIPADDVDVVEDYMNAARIKCLMDKMQQVLTPREMLIISRRYGVRFDRALDSRGVMSYEGMTQCDLAKTLGISRSYVSRIEKRALEKLREVLVENGLE